jgi:hypothetical protein
VFALYQDLLHRYPEPAGFASWTGMLAAGATRAAIVEGIYNSLEHRELQVEQFYQTYLHRSPDPAGQALWVSELLGGASELALEGAFLTSPEYAAAHPDNTSYVTALYADVLGRAADPAGLNAWENVCQLANGRAIAAQAFLTSLEANTELLDAYYTDYLRQPPDSAGSAAWLKAMSSSTNAPALVARGILTSGEFFALQ